MEVYTKINELLQTGNLSQIEAILKDLITFGSDDECFLVGELFVDYGFYDEAEMIFNHLLAIYENEGELLISLAEILAEKGEEDKAILHLEKISANDDTYPQALLLLADLYESEGLYEVCEQKLLQAKKLLPNERIIDFALGQFYHSQGEFNKAFSSLKKASEDKDLASKININENLAELLSGAGKFEEALPYYEKAIDFNLEINTLFKYGLTALQAKEYKLAIKKLTELKQLDYEYHSLYLALATAYLKEGLINESLATIKEGIKVDEYNKELYFLGAEVQMHLNNRDEAEKFLRESIAIDPSYNEAVMTLNDILRQEERYSEIISLLNHIGEFGEENPQYIWDRAYALEQLENYSEAMTNYKLAYDSFKNDEEFLNDYGNFLIEEGKVAAAVEIFTKLTKIDETNEFYIDIVERLTSK